MENIEDIVRRTEKQVSKLYSALCGNEITKQGGLIQLVEETKSDLGEFKKDIRARVGKVETVNNRLATYVKILWFAAGSIATAMFVIFLKK